MPAESSRHEAAEAAGNADTGALEEEPAAATGPRADEMPAAGELGSRPVDGDGPLADALAERPRAVPEEAPPTLDEPVPLPPTLGVDFIPPLVPDEPAVEEKAPGWDPRAPTSEELIRRGRG